MITTQDAPHRPTARTRLLLLIKIAVSGGLLVVLFRQTDLDAVGLHLRHVLPAWLGAALLLLAAMVAVSAWRWRVLLEAQGVACGLRPLASSFLVATFFNNFLPSNIGGDVVRVADTAPLTGSRTLAAGVVLADRGLGLLALLLVAACGSWLAGTRAAQESTYLWLVLMGATAAGVPTLIAPGLIDRAFAPLRWLGNDQLNVRLERLKDMVVRFGSQRGALLSAFAGAIVVQLLLVGFYVAVAQALQIPLSLWGALLVVPVSLVFQMLPVSINGFGVREAVFTYYFARLGLPVDAALAVSLVSTATLALFSTAGGVVFLLRPRRA